RAPLLAAALQGAHVAAEVAAAVPSRRAIAPGPRRRAVAARGIAAGALVHRAAQAGARIVLAGAVEAAAGADLARRTLATRLPDPLHGRRPVLVSRSLARAAVGRRARGALVPALALHLVGAAGRRLGIGR